jgi:hypothetical protein
MTEQIRDMVPKLEEYLEQPQLTEEQSVFLKAMNETLRAQVRENGIPLSHSKGEDSSLSSSDPVANAMEFGIGHPTLYLVSRDDRFCCGSGFSDFLRLGSQFFSTKKQFDRKSAAEYAVEARGKIEEVAQWVENCLGPKSWAPQLRTLKEYEEKCAEAVRKVSGVLGDLEQRFVRVRLDRQIAFKGKDVVLLGGGDIPRESFSSTIYTSDDLRKWYLENKGETPDPVFEKIFQTTLKHNEQCAGCRENLETINHLLYKHGANRVFTINSYDKGAYFYIVTNLGDNKYETKARKFGGVIIT